MKNLEQTARALFIHRGGVLSALEYLALEDIPDDRCRLKEYARALNCGEQVLHDAFLRTAEEITQWHEEQIITIALGSAWYPAQLAYIHEPPLVLFAKGEIELLSAERISLAMVGSRKGDSEACELTRKMAVQLASRGVTIVSGLAAGIDAAAHRGALAASEGKTIAVLGNGLRQIYPAFHRELTDQIIERGSVLLSQFEPATAPYPSNFLNRNRIIAGLSLGVIVIQAADRSGSLVTARYALEEGREVLVVPGPVSGSRYAGSHRLLRDGATLITCAEDIFETLPQISPAKQTIATQNIPQVVASLSHEEQLIFEALQDGALAIAELQQLFPVRGQLETTLLTLEFSGFINREPGGIVRLTR